MSIRYISTRGQSPAVSFSEAVARGLAPDGGLYLPEKLPNLPKDFARKWADLSYPDLCREFFLLFADDLSGNVLDGLCRQAYSTFTDKDIAPLRKVTKSFSILELYHGPTLAFKDFALQLLGRLYGEQIKRTGKPITVLGATSGDTGAAAIHGLKDIEAARTFILYPAGKVSPLQERQMTCTGSNRVFPLAIEGNFDDAQRALKEVFADHEFAEKVGLSAVNSINLARILAQSVYYLYAWLQWPEENRERLRFIVPTGNFGNVFAGWLVARMGLPVGGFHVATNRNDILFRFFSSGEYRPDAVNQSLAPSMDIQAASNFERFLYYIHGEDSALVRETMAAIKKGETVQIPTVSFEDVLRPWSVSRADDAVILERIKEAWDDYKLVLDPHTATGYLRDFIKSKVPLILLSTAHPAKFPDTIEKSIGQHPVDPSLEALKGKDPVSYPVEATPEAIKKFVLAAAV